MKKITGKVVSLVLALALVVTSFSANFAFAATKSTSGTVSKTEQDDVYLVNGGNKEIDLNAFLITGDFKLETKNHDEVSDPKVTAISHVSGDRLVSLKLSGDDDDDATLKLKNSSDNGTEVISVLVSGDYTDDDGNEYTVKGSQKLTVHVYDKGELVFGKATPNGVGEGVDELDAFPMTAGAEVNVGIYTVDANSANDAYAKFVPATSLYLSDDKDGYKDSGYQLDITSGDSDFHLSGLQIDKTATAADLTTPGYAVATIGKMKNGAINGDASTGNITITAKKLVKDGNKTTYKTSSDSDDKYTLKTKIDKKVDVATLMSYNSTTSGSIVTPGATVSGVPYSTALKANNSGYQDSGFTIEKSSGKSVLNDVEQFDGNEAIVTDKEVYFSSSLDADKVSIDKDTNVRKVSGYMATLDIGDANVGSVDIDHGNVDLADGKVGDISTDDSVLAGSTHLATPAGDVTITSGKAGNIDTGSAADNADTVTINGGSTGTIETDGTVDIQSTDSDEAITTGKITALKVTANADEAKISIGGVTVNDDDADVTVYSSGDADVTVGPIDFDFYDATLNLGDEDDEDNAFVGTIAAPLNAINGKIATQNDDTDVTVTGAVKIDTLSLDTDANITFKDAVTVGTIDGDGTFTVGAGKLYITDSASSARMKISDTLTNGLVAFKADAGNVDVDDLDTYGFTVDKTTASGVDTFKVASTSFAGVAINKTSSSIAKGYSETFTAVAYPNGTSLPAGYTVKWELDGGSEDVFDLTTSGNTAKIEVTSIDSTFASENHTTLTATLYDEDGYELDDYDAAKCSITATAVPEATSDTTKDFSVAKGSAYQFKITSATAPTFTTGTAGVFSVALASKNGNDYFYKITAIGNVGASTGIYLNGVKLLVASVKAPAFTTDTTKDVTVKGAYTLKVTAAATPTFALGTAGVFKAEFVSKTGNDYLYKITSVGAVGAKTGVYVNGVKTFVATVG